MAASAAAFGISLSLTGAVPALASSAGQATPSSIIVVSPGQSIQQAVNHAHPGDTILIKPGVYRQTVQIRKDGITLRGSGDSLHGTVLRPPHRRPHTVCRSAFGVTGVCVLAKKIDVTTGKVFQRVHNDTVTGLYVAGFPDNGVFGYGTDGLTVTNVTAVNDGGYGISRFVSSRTLFADDVAIGNHEAGFYVGDSPHADTVVRDNVVFTSSSRFNIPLIVGFPVFQGCLTLSATPDATSGLQSAVVSFPGVQLRDTSAHDTLHAAIPVHP